MNYKYKSIYPIFYVSSLLLNLACNSGSKYHEKIPPSLLTANSILDIQRALKIGDLNCKDLANPGPFSFTKTKKILTLDKTSSETTENQDRIEILTLTPRNISQEPDTVLFVHGNGGSLQDHFTNASLTSSWGFQSILVSLPSTERWIHNGILLRKIINSLQEELETKTKVTLQTPSTSKFYIVAFSFGATAASIALADGAKADLLLLLDPALYSPMESHKLGEIKTPVILLGSDKKIFKTKYRDLFYEQLSSKFIEVEIIGATHNDAIDPYLFANSLPSFFENPRKSVFQSALIYSLIFQRSLDGDKQIISQLDQFMREGLIKNLKYKINHKWNTP